MGTFAGHALPGTFFVFFGLWGVINAFIKYFESKESGAKFISSVSNLCPRLCWRFKDWPLDGVLKILFTTVGFCLEIYTGIKDGEFLYIGNAQHATMFFFFGLTGIIDILVHYRAPLPPGTDYISSALAFIVEGLLFNFHLHGRSQLDVMLHTLLLYVVVGSVLSIFVEMRYRNHLLAPLIRCHLMILQGTWFWQVGNILYSPLGVVWVGDDHRAMTIATLYFTWHAGVIFVVILLIGGLLSCRYRGRGQYIKPLDSFKLNRLIDSAGYRNSCVDDAESESDLESQKPAVVIRTV